jgi:hypothetical protein
VAILAAFALAFMGACGEQPTEVGVLAVGEVAFAMIGDPGDADDAPASSTSVDHSYVFPSTNAANIAALWANVTWNANDAGLGVAPLKFTQPRNFAACFEIRIDDEAPESATHFNSDITDGRWAYQCVGGVYGPGPIEETFTANSHVDVRMSFGAERDERFDWTRFYVMSIESKDECRDGGWQAFGFANQGQCIRYIETGKN